MLKDFIVIDIETMPNVEVLPLLPEPKISKVLKDAAKIEAATETAKAIKKGKKEKAVVVEPVVAEAPVATSTDETTNG